MSYRVQFTDTAKEDLRALAFHLADNSKNKEQAKRFVREALCSFAGVLCHEVDFCISHLAHTDLVASTKKLEVYDILYRKTQIIALPG